uniref:RxLR effector protein n=1 Tax=Phytophthora ramorum TaxID=164328 RepID=H3H527_PHYRM
MAQAAKNKLTSNNQATTDKLFKKLQVGEIDDKLFQSTQFKEWVTTVTKNFKKNTKLAQASMVSALVSHFGDEALAKMIAGAKTSASTAATAKKLEQVQLNKWISEGLAKMLVTAKQDGTASSIVRKLEEVQFKNWQSDGKSADDVYNLLKLNLERGDILKSPMLTTWISYTAKLDENPYQLLLVKLMKRYDDATLTKMFVAAKRGRATESIGTKLEEVQLKSWLSDGKTADDVFKLLQLNKDGDTIFASSVWSVWSSYLTKLDKENADELMFVVLKKHYGGDEGVAKMVGVANKEASTKDIGRKLEEELWRSQGKDGDDIFKLLKLDEEGQTFFESPALSTWISYVTKLNKLNKQNPGAISQLEKRFGGDIEVARMIGFAKQQASNAVTENVITQLQNVQFKQWLGNGRTLNTISDKMESALFDTRNTKVILDYSDFLKASAAGTG